MVIADNRIQIGEGLGNRYLSDCVFYPSLDHYPDCYVRLRDESMMRDDNIPKETVLLDFNRAQDFIVGEAIKAGCTSTGLTAMGTRKATYLAPPV